MPVIKHSVRLSPGESAAVDHVSFAIQDGLDQFWVLIWVVLEISILNDYKIASSGLNSGSQRCPLTHVFLMKNQLINLGSDLKRKQVPSAISRKVIHQDDFLVLVGGCMNRIQKLLYGFNFVVTGNDDT